MKTLLHKSMLTALVGTGLILSQATVAAVSAEKAAQLGKNLTPTGAEKAGNGGAIPAWTGGITKPVAG